MYATKAFAATSGSDTKLSGVTATWIRSLLIGQYGIVKTPFCERRIVYADRISSGRSLKRIETFIHMDSSVVNYNLLCLSFIIPPNAIIVRAMYDRSPEGYGRRLYFVLWQIHQKSPEQHAHAGIGWVREAREGRGLFVAPRGDNCGELI